jgi:hypothetical protein
MAEKLRTAVVQYNGVSYVRNLSLCRRALTARQVEGNFLTGITGLADSIACGRSTVSRFYSGLNTSADVTARILGALKLGFDEVHNPIDPPPDGLNVDR